MNDLLYYNLLICFFVISLAYYFASNTKSLYLLRIIWFPITETFQYRIWFWICKNFKFFSDTRVYTLFFPL